MPIPPIEQPIIDVTLGADQPYQHFDLALTVEEIEACKKLKVERTDVLNLTFHDDQDNLLDCVNSFLQSVGPNHEVSITVATAFLNILIRLLKSFKKEAADIVIRSYTPSPVFEQPRWHTDGYYYPPASDDNYHYKAVFTLLGPGTLFHKLPTQQRDDFNQIQSNPAKAAEMLKDVHPDTAELGTGTLFIAGHPKDSAVHSEPNVSKDQRIFCAIIPSTKKQLEDKKVVQELADAGRLDLVAQMFAGTYRP